ARREPATVGTTVSSSKGGPLALLGRSFRWTQALATGPRAPSPRHARPGERTRLWTEPRQRHTLAPTRQHKATLGTLGSSHDRQGSGWHGRHHRRAEGWGRGV